MNPSYDPTLKTLVETSPTDWLTLLGLPRQRITIDDTDLAPVVSGAVDKVFRVHARPEYLLHLDFQSGHDSASRTCFFKRCWGRKNPRSTRQFFGKVALPKPRNSYC